MTFAIAFVLDLIAFDYEPIAKGSLGWTIRSPTLDIPGVNQVVDWIVPDPQDKLDFSQPREQVVVFLVLFGLHRARAAQPPALGERPGDARGPEHRGRGPYVGHLAGAQRRLSIFALSAGIAGLRRRAPRDRQLLRRANHRATADRARLARGRGDVRCSTPRRRAARRAQLRVHHDDLHLDRRRLPLGRVQGPHDVDTVHGDPVRSRRDQPREEPRRSAGAHRPPADRATRGPRAQGQDRRGRSRRARR